MLRSVKPIRLFAILALLAWSNVQAMVCCLAMPLHGSSEKVEAAVSTVEDHSCCPGGESQGVPGNPDSPEPSGNGCGMAQQGASALCCTQSDPAREAVPFSSSFSFVQAPLVASLFPALPGKSPKAIPPAETSAPGGVPRYLALERILI
jgi:hypothetical protein